MTIRFLLIYIYKTEASEMKIISSNEYTNDIYSNKLKVHLQRKQK